MVKLRLKLKNLSEILGCLTEESQCLTAMVYGLQVSVGNLSSCIRRGARGRLNICVFR